MVKKQFFMKTIIAATVLSSIATYANNDTLPSRPINTYNVTNLPQRPDSLSENDKQDIASLIEAAKKNQNVYEKQARETEVQNHKRIGEMPVPKTERDVMTDAVTGSISQSDITDNKQNKIAGDFYYILVSSSLSDEELRNMFSQYKGRNDVAFVIRGVRNKENMLQELSHWQQLVLDSGSSAPVNLDPTLFKSYNVTSIPTIIHEKDGKLISRVTGISNVGFLKGKTGDLGTAGPSKEISEISLLDLIQQSISKLDFDKMKKEPLENYWKKQKFQSFPDVVKRNEKKFTPSVVIPQDILSPNGQIVAKRGKINPLSVIPFRLKLIFFDARIEWQRKIAKREYQNTAVGIEPILITTNVYGDGWQTFKDATAMYGQKARLYMIQPGMSERFNVTALPSVVTGTDTQYVVDEYPNEGAEKDD